MSDESDFHAEVRRMLLRSRHLKDQLDALAEDFVELHKPTADYEEEELMRCIYDDPSTASYGLTQIRIDAHRELD